MSIESRKLWLTHWKELICTTPLNCVLVSDQRGTLIEPSKTGGKSLKP